MEIVKIKGNEFHTNSDLPKVGDLAKDFLLTKVDLSDVKLSDFEDKRIVLNIFPSVDTPVCAASVRRFNAEAEKLEDTVVLCVSKDMPFAHARFCGAEGLEKVISLSELRNSNFSETYGVKIVDGPMAGLMARSVIVIEKDKKIGYVQLVDEITAEPNYDDVMNHLK